MIPYREKEHLEPILKLSKQLKAVDESFFVENVDQQYDIIKMFENKLYEKYIENGIDFSLFQKHFKYINPSKTDINSLIGKWAFFPDIGMQLGFQEAFGIVYGARDTNSWQGMTYFVKRPHIKSLIQISNSSILLFDMESEVLKFKTQDRTSQDLLNLLNIYCEFLHDEKWIIGKLISFDLNVVTFETLEGDHFDLKIEEYKDKTRNFKEDISDLSFILKIS
jgi:hypothetical protein